MKKPDPKRFNLPERRTLGVTDVGQLGAAVLALTRELWVLTDRMSLLEAVLAKHGIDVTAEIEAWQVDETMRAELNRKGERLVESVVGTLAGIAQP